ncbi:MAG TPA: N-acetylneuraminate synthase family protein, partial [Polyangiaceae bacterium]|nr:N-acetylneuraminate synthase family protein [Polyangiaceae bacterium]
MRIGAHDTSQKVLVVAEIGNNHEGSFGNAEKLVRAAAACGVDAVKFQTFRTKWFTSGADPARFERLRRFELSFDEFKALEGLARELGVLFVSTPLDLESAKFLEPLVDAFKIASGDNDFWALLDWVGRSPKPMIVSTGMSSLTEVERARDFVFARKPPADVAFLHCVSAYPAPPEQVNLAAIPLLRERLGCTIGYSDHTLGVEAALASVALGARIIEKHFTLDKHFSDFRDHQLSADPDEMARIVKHIRAVERLVGKPEKRVQPAEEAVVSVARRSIAAAADLPRGHRLAIGDLTWLRPRNGLRPGDEEQIVGR